MRLHAGVGGGRIQGQWGDISWAFSQNGAWYLKSKTTGREDTNSNRGGKDRIGQETPRREAEVRNAGLAKPGALPNQKVT